PGTAATVSLLSGGQLINANLNPNGLTSALGGTGVLGGTGAGPVASLLPAVSNVLGGVTQGGLIPVSLSGSGSGSTSVGGPLGTVVGSLTGSGTASAGNPVTTVVASLT